MNKPIWEGIYKSFKDAPIKGPGFESDMWITNSEKKIVNSIEKLKKNEFISPILSYRENLLPFLAAILTNPYNKLRILDFGGGFGITFLEVISGMIDAKNLEFHIIENKTVCERGKILLKKVKTIKFYSNLPENEKYDIVHICSSLHYIDEWEGLLKQLSEYKPVYFMFNDLLAGDITSYVSIQNYYESRIPVWFLNINDFIQTMNELGYSLIFKSRFSATILGIEQQIPQDNFPPKYRIGHSSNLLFKIEE